MKKSRTISEMIRRLQKIAEGVDLHGKQLSTAIEAEERLETILRPTLLTEMVDDWVAQTRWGGQEAKIEYLNKLWLLRNYLSQEDIIVVPYKNLDGSYDYDLLRESKKE